MQTSGEAPCGRVGAAAAAIGSEIYVFGGRTGKDFGDSSLNDLRVLDTRSGDDRCYVHWVCSNVMRLLHCL